MKYFLILFMLFPLIVSAEVNKEYSFKDFMGQSLVDVPVEELNNSEIVGSCFYQEGEPDKVIFPEKMEGVTFRRCNLDNVHIPKKNVLITEGWEACTNKKIKVQNDWEDWILDEALKPKEPMNKEERIEKNISIDPKDLPIEKFTKKQRELFEEKFHEEAIIIPIK